MLYQFGQILSEFRGFVLFDLGPDLDKFGGLLERCDPLEFLHELLAVVGHLHLLT